MNEKIYFISGKKKHNFVCIGMKKFSSSYQKYFCKLKVFEGQENYDHDELKLIK